ncbi:MAG TPA: SRPBCC domain-containing protein, partial [Caulobacteraceae bacterium]|nr:SRPBCC domain-containing protein [Caulobacteraceae bacterium]
MNETSTETLSVVVEREMPFPPEKVWRALTQPHLIEEWLMKNDFQPVMDHRFTLRGDWGSVDCQVMAVEPNKTLAYSWGALGLGSVVTWT